MKKVYFLRDAPAEVLGVALLLQPGVNEVSDAAAARLLEISQLTPEQLEAGLEPLCRVPTEAEDAAHEERKRLELERAEQEAAAKTPPKRPQVRRAAREKE